MKSRFFKNRISAITCLVSLLIALGFGLARINSSFNNSAEAQATEAQIVATVEGRQIQAKIYRMYLKNGIEAVGLSEKTEDGRKKIEILKEGIISDLIDRALIQAEAERRGLAISEERFAASHNKRIAEMGGDDLYRAYLKDAAITDEDFRQMIRQEIYGELLRKDFEKTISITEAEARSFYDKEKSNAKFESLFVEQELVGASHILISARRSVIANELRAKGITEKAELDRRIAEETAKRRERAAAILKKAQSGADFAALAKENSEDPGTKARGGDLGLFTRNTHTAKFDEAAFSLKAGQLSRIVETDYGFHIIKVAERKPQRTRAFAEVRPAIEQHLTARKLGEQLSHWLEERRRAADVEIAPAYRVGQLQARQ